ncbi:MAG: phosphoribosyltransferase family protein [Solirubrobacteraceae bacterium]
MPRDDVRFADRHDAGRQLAAALRRFRELHPVVVAIPRGGVPVAAEIARALEAPLDVIMVRKIGAPWQPEYAIGAVAEGGVRILAERELQLLGIGAADAKALIARAEQELDERCERYRGTRRPVEVRDRTVLLVDDGLATGRTAKAAARALRERGAARVVLAVPVAAAQSIAELGASVDEVIALQTPKDLLAIGYWYHDFRPTADEEVTSLLTRSTTMSATQERLVEAGAGVLVPGDLTIPQNPRGIVAFAHGSGSSRLSPRNRQVAQALNTDGFATLLFDLLTPEEELDRANVFDIPLLGRRLAAATGWLRHQPETSELALGYFGASTGAAAALIAAADLGHAVSAVVSRGGRPDLAAPRLGEVVAPTLLIVGGLDQQVLELNRQAQRQLRCTNDLEVVIGATHLFEEPGTLEAVARLASDWFARHLAGTRAPEPALHNT